MVSRRVNKLSPFAQRLPRATPAPPDPALEIAQARAAFERLVALEQAYDPALAELYADEGAVIEVFAPAAGELAPRVREIPLRRYKAALPYALLLSKRAGERAQHRAIETEWIGPGEVRVRTERVSSQSRAPAPYEALLKRDASGAWRVVMERATLLR